VFAGGYSREHLDLIHEKLSDLLTAGTLRNAVTAHVPFDEVPRGVQTLADRAVIGKLVMEGPRAS